MFVPPPPPGGIGPPFGEKDSAFCDIPEVSTKMDCVVLVLLKLALVVQFPDDRFVQPSTKPFRPTGIFTTSNPLLPLNTRSWLICAGEMSCWVRLAIHRWTIAVGSFGSQKI